MDKFNYAVDSNVILDKCGQCGGLWCDGRELDDLLRYVKGRDDLRQMGRGVLRHTERLQTLAELEELGNRLRQPANPYAWIFLPFVVPLGDGSFKGKFPVAVTGLVLLNSLIFAIQALAVTNERAFLETFGLISVRIITGEGFATLLTSMFVHGGVWHLAGNMLYLWIFGDNIEERFGLLRFLLFYLGVGVLADLPHVLFFPTSTVPLVGSSGAIAGLLGAYFVLHPWSKIRLFVFGSVVSLPAWLVLGVWFGMQVFSGLVEMSSGSLGKVAWWSHLSGFAFGAILVYVWCRKDAPQAAG